MFKVGQARLSYDVWYVQCLIFSTYNGFIRTQPHHKSKSICTSTSLNNVKCLQSTPTFYAIIMYFNSIYILYIHKILLLLFCSKYLCRIIHIYIVVVALQLFLYVHASIWDHFSFSLKNSLQYFLLLLVFCQKILPAFVFLKMSFGCRLTVTFFINLKINHFIVF